MRDTEKQPTCKVVARRKGNYYGNCRYALYENGELWLSDKHDAFRAGYVDNADSIESAIDVFEEEIRCEMALVREEFGY